MRIIKTTPIGETIEISSMTKAAKDAGLSRNTFSKRIKEDGRVRIFKTGDILPTIYTKLQRPQES